jgi:YrbI family 3-deoxy-D-manno-octulosonate 8-phosphate phosphatase
MIGLEEKLSKLKVIISGVDGILNSGEHPIDELGNVPFKVFNFKDFEAINELKKYFKIVFISADNKVSFHLFRNRNIPFFYNNKDKKVEVSKILRRYSVTPEEVMYMGCTFSDLKCMNMIPFSVCTEDAISDVKNVSSSVLPIYGGMGVFCTLYDLLKPEIKRRILK